MKRWKILGFLALTMLQLPGSFAKMKDSSNVKATETPRWFVSQKIGVYWLTNVPKLTQTQNWPIDDVYCFSVVTSLERTLNDRWLAMIRVYYCGHKEDRCCHRFFAYENKPGTCW